MNFLFSVLLFSSISFKPDSLAPDYYYSYQICKSVGFTEVHLLKLSLMQNIFFVFSDKISDSRDWQNNNSSEKLIYSRTYGFSSGKWKLHGDTLSLFPNFIPDSVSANLKAKRVDFIVSITGKSLNKIETIAIEPFPKTMSSNPYKKLP